MMGMARTMRMKFGKPVKDSLWDRLSLSLISIFLVLGIMFAMTCPFQPVGESDDYIISTVAFVNHPLSQKILPSDIETIGRWFPAHYEDSKSNYEAALEHGAISHFKSPDGNVYPWYMATYSVSVVPVLALLKLLGLPLSQTYYLANILWYVAALLVVYFKLRLPRKNVFLALLLLAASPSIVYYQWNSAELFICALMIMSLVFFVNDRHSWAALLCALASTLNITICGFAFSIIGDCFAKMVAEREKSDTALLFARRNIRQTLILGACCLPALITPVFNMAVAGVLNLQNTLVSDVSLTYMWGGRFLAYLFDLNFGFLPNYPILLPLFFASVILSLARHSRKGITLAIGFFAVLSLYSCAWHINSGMQIIARYSTWLSPFLVFSAVTQLQLGGAKKLIAAAKSALLVLSAAITFAVFIFVFRNNAGNYLHFSPIAKIVLETAPALYNPYPFTFVNRTRHVDGGYWFTGEPTVYADDGGFVKKILIPEGTSGMLAGKLYGDATEIGIINAKLDGIRARDKRFAYVNVSGSEVFYNPGYPERFDPLERSDLNTHYGYKGLYYWENTFHWAQPEAEIVLPAERIQEAGLELSFYPAPYLLAFTETERPATTIYVNGKIAAKQILAEGEVSTVFIPPQDLPQPEYGFYNIRLVTNAVFNPKERGMSGTDSRNLAVGIQYIGPTR
jgi:hypothetical protein